MSLPPVRASKRGQTHTVIRQGKAPEGVEERMVPDPLSATVGGVKRLVAVPVRRPLRDGFDPYHGEEGRSDFEDEDEAARTERAIIDRA